MNTSKSLSDIGQYPNVTLTGNNEKDADLIETHIMSIEGPKLMHRERPYNGQPHTTLGVRGQTEIKGLTFRDLRDCYIRGFIISHDYYKPGTLERWEPNATLIDEAKKGVKAQLNGNDVYGLEGNIDPMAVEKNTSLEIERIMGIYPNVIGFNKGSDNE